jgi:hypothetical protein
MPVGDWSQEQLKALEEALTEPKAATRDAIISMEVKTRADAMAVLAVLLERGDDSELASYLLQGLRVHLSAA